MKNFVLAIISCILGSASLAAQSDFSISKPLNIDKSTPLDSKSDDSGASLRMPSLMNEPLRSRADEPRVKMLPDQELLQAGHDLNLTPKIKEKSSGAYFGDQYLGDVKTTSEFLGILCRDHEYVDGDRIKVYLNGEVVEVNLLLSASFKGIHVSLSPGFNHIEFEALNEGSSSPNTAQVRVVDREERVIYNSFWNLSTGSKASFIVIKEDEEK